MCNIYSSIKCPNQAIINGNKLKMIYCTLLDHSRIKLEINRKKLQEFYKYLEADDTLCRAHGQ